MAEMKYLNSRLQLKYDSYENWSKAENQKDLLPGEIAIAYLGPTHTTTTPDNGTHPVLFKVGPGKFNTLPWASALAADVYEWAKCEHVELDGEVIKFYNGTDKTNPKHSIDLSKFALNSEIGDLTNLSTTNKTDLVTAINEVRQAVEVGGTGSVVTVAKEATPTTGSSATYVIKQGDKVVAGEKIEIPVLPTSFEISATATDDDVVVLTGTAGTNGVTYDAKHAKKGPAGGAEKGATAEATVNGYGATATIKVPKVKVDEYGHVNELSEQTLSITMPGAPEYKTLTVGSKTYNTTADVEITAADLGLSNAMHFVGVFTEAPENPVAGDVYLNSANHKEYVYDTANGWVELGDEGSYALKTVSITGTDGLTGGGTIEANRTISHAVPTNAAEGDHKGTGERTYLTNVKTDKFGHIVGFETASESDQDLSNYKTKQTAVADQAKVNEYVSAVSQDENGVITVTRVALPDDNDTTYSADETSLTLSGDNVFSIKDKGVSTAKIADHAVGAAQVKSEKDYTGSDAEIWVFYCGSATELI